jgi:hypothetical protein
MADFYGFHPPAAAGGGGGSGTVTSVGLSDGSDTPIYDISGSPVTTAGTLTFTLADQTANTVFAGPTTGSPNQPAFRALGYSDLPVIANNTVLGNKSGGAAVPSAQALGTVTEATSAVLTLSGWANSVVGTPTIRVLQSSGSQSGYLSSTDWTTFNNKQASLSFGNLTGNVAANISVTGGTGAVIGSGTSIAQLVANGSQNGYLSSVDWTTFNNKGSGSVTSVALSVPATSIFGVTGSPVTTTGTLGLTTTGTSGGIPYFSSTSQLASSAAFTASQLIIGGGAGATPATLAAGSQYQVLRMGAANPAYGAVNLDQSAAVTGTLPTGNGGTGRSANYTSQGVVYADTTTSLANVSPGAAGTVLTSNGASAPSMQDLRGNATVFKAPTIQKFTSGTGTYTTPISPSPLYIRVEMCGGGGGGGGSGTAGGTAAGDGGTSTFGTTLLSCNGGVKGTYVGAGGAGGSASLGSGPIGTVLSGGSGSGGGGSSTSGVSYGGGHGGVNPFGGGGGGGSPSAAGLAGVANTGGGGGGGGAPSAGNCGSGGGAGGYVDAFISSPSATYAYAIGASGTAGGAGTGGVAGGAGGTGYIIVREYYQ